MQPGDAEENCRRQVREILSTVMSCKIEDERKQRFWKSCFGAAQMLSGVKKLFSIGAL
jgi:hypothetical protein